MAHLFCEMYVRLHAVGLAENGSCELPLTQAQLGDALGVSGVHVNRTLMELRGRDLIELRGKGLAIRDLEMLKSVAMFNPGYLHLDRVGRDFDSDEP